MTNGHCLLILIKTPSSLKHPLLNRHIRLERDLGMTRRNAQDTEQTGVLVGIVGELIELVRYLARVRT